MKKDVKRILFTVWRVATSLSFCLDFTLNEHVFKSIIHLQATVSPVQEVLSSCVIALLVSYITEELHYIHPLKVSHVGTPGYFTEAKTSHHSLAHFDNKVLKIICKTDFTYE